ncbi:MAG: S1 RNA-binding domain-containing protein [Acidobacteriota bacterium]
MNDDHHDDDDFGALLDASFAAQKPLPSTGDRVRATVVTVGSDHLMLETECGHEAILTVASLSGDELPDPTVGDQLEAYVLGVRERLVELGLKLGAGGASGRARIEQAAASGLPIDGVVQEVNKGGYVIGIGTTRAFCPMGAMDIRRIEDPQTMVGKSLTFRVTELRGPRDVVVSRRVLLEEEQERLAAETRAVLEVGATLRGRVRDVRDFGAFVDLGGLDGMIPARELTHARRRPQDVVSPGDELQVQVLEIGTDAKGRERITLSLRALQEDPLDQVLPSLQPGTLVSGRVTRLQPFGAFVELVPGVEGLIHVSAFGRRIGTPAEVVSEGQDVAVRVDKVDTEARRIGLHYLDPAELESDARVGPLGLRLLRQVVTTPSTATDATAGGTAPADAASGSAPAIGDIREVTVDRVARFGIFVTWDDHRGLIPQRELDLPPGAEAGKAFPRGSTLEAVIIEIRDDGKLTLSQVGVERARERENAASYQAQAPKSSGSGGGLATLGDLFGHLRKD